MWLIILIILVLLCFGGGGFYGNGAYRTSGFSVGTLLLIVLVVLFLTGNIHV
jgi:hypothetical protein